MFRGEEYHHRPDAVRHAAVSGPPRLHRAPGGGAGDERPAFKDTIKALPGEVSRVIARFDLPSGTETRRGQKFRYVFHCHVLEHEDNDVMRPYDVVG